MKTLLMKIEKLNHDEIGCITDDGHSISPHFGRARYYAVLSIKEGCAIARKLFSKIGHQSFSDPDGAALPGARHGTSAASHSKHVSLLQMIRDGQVSLWGGMGYEACQNMEQLGIRPAVTGIVVIPQAVQAYTDGDLQDHPQKLH